MDVGRTQLYTPMRKAEEEEVEEEDGHTPSFMGEDLVAKQVEIKITNAGVQATIAVKRMYGNKGMHECNSRSQPLA